MATYRKRKWHMGQCDICAWRQPPLPEMDPATGRCWAPITSTGVQDIIIIGPPDSNGTSRSCKQFVWQYDSVAIYQAKHKGKGKDNG